MPERRGTAAIVAAALALATAGCAGDTADPTGTGSGSTSADAGASAPFELVATDELSVSPDGSEVLADCWNGICRWDTETGALELVPDRGSVAVAADWSTVATVDGADIVLEDLDSGDTVAELSGLAESGVTDGSSVTAVSYSPDGSRVAAAALSGADGVVVVWSVADGSEVARFVTDSEVHTVAFSPDGERIATSGNGPIEVHDLDGGDAETLESGEGGTVVWSPDGRRLLGPGTGDQPVIWDAADWRQVAELSVPGLHEAAFAPDSTKVALTTLRATTVSLWDIDDDAATEVGASSTVPGAVAWSPDGSGFYAVYAEEGVQAWDADGHPLGTDFEVPEGR